MSRYWPIPLGIAAWALIAYVLLVLGGGVQRRLPWERRGDS